MSTERQLLHSSLVTKVRLSFWPLSSILRLKDVCADRTERQFLDPRIHERLSPSFHQGQSMLLRDFPEYILSRDVCDHQHLCWNADDQTHSSICIQSLQRLLAGFPNIIGLISDQSFQDSISRHLLDLIEFQTSTFLNGPRAKINVFIFFDLFGESTFMNETSLVGSLQRLLLDQLYRQLYAKISSSNDIEHKVSYINRNMDVCVIVAPPSSLQLPLDQIRRHALVIKSLPKVPMIFVISTLKNENVGPFESNLSMVLDRHYTVVTLAQWMSQGDLLQREIQCHFGPCQRVYSFLRYLIR